MDKLNVIPSIIKFISKIQVLVSVVLSSGLLVCLPSRVMAKMQLTSLRRNFGWLVSLVFIVFASWLLIRFTIWLFKVLLNFRLLLKSQRYMVHEASKAEIELLDYLFNRPGYTASLILDDSDVKGLLLHGIATRTGNTLQPDYVNGSGSFSTAITLQNWSVKYYRKHQAKIQANIEQRRGK